MTKGLLRSAPFTLLREDVALTATSTANGSKRTVSATLADADTPATLLAGLVVSFYADGTHIGDAVTGSDGRASLQPPGGARGKTVYEARFAGSERHLPARATA